jgi:hypothetical protein
MKEGNEPAKRWLAKSQRYPGHRFHTFGVLCGISGVEHSFFETLQGNFIQPGVETISTQALV